MFSRLSTSTIFVNRVLGPLNEEMEDPEMVEPIVELLLVRDGVPLQDGKAGCASRR